uniref:Uncharacterized protein n=1 Tax=Chelonoidis abingdonii TaxID=106734 RepID=A0A8C0GC82_CHEAB
SQIPAASLFAAFWGLHMRIYWANLSSRSEIEQASARAWVDVVCNDGSTVYAPFSDTIERKVIPYKISNAINNGLQLHGSDFCIKMLYIKVYPGITSHVSY